MGHDRTIQQSQQLMPFYKFSNAILQIQLSPDLQLQPIVSFMQNLLVVN